MGSHETFDQDRLNRLSEAAIEDRLTEEEILELKSIVLNDPKALEAHVDRLCDHAILTFQGRGGNVPVDEGRLRNAFDLERNRPGRKGRHLRTTGRSFWNRFVSISVLIAFFVVLPAVFSFLWHSFGRSGDDRFVTVVKTSNCLWKDTPTTTRPGGRLGPCLLRLERGVAVIRFDCDTLVSLEGPTEFEIRGRKHTVLHFGRLVAEIESSKGHGFVVETGETTIKDFGTKFGLYAPKNRPLEVSVIEGRIEVFSQETEETVSLGKGESIVVQEKSRRARTQETDRELLSSFQIGTTAGRGKEGWVVNDTKTFLASGEHFPGRILKPYMLVKTSKPDDPKSDRKSIFTIDLAAIGELDWTNISEVELFLSYGPTELGYASSVPDSTFTVYGLVDESCDNWDPETLTWKNFPGNGPRHTFQDAFWRPLGSFKIEQGSRTGTVEIKGDVLKEFIRSDTNDLATFAIARDTYATENYGLVHGFANRHHPEMMPPRLRFRLLEDDTEKAEKKK